MKTLFTLLAFVFSIPALLIAQTPTSSIRGLVLDQASETPIPNATVILLGTDPVVGTVTNVNGEFLLPTVQVGRHDIRVSFIGYEPAFLRGVEVSSGKATALTVRLAETVTTMAEVVVTAADKKEEPLNIMATVSARQLSVEEAQKYAGGFDDPARLVSAFAGVASNGVSSNGIVIRGNAPKGLLWRLEGVDIPAPNHFGEVVGFGDGGVTALSSQMMANSDFFTGAFPAEYGNGLSGVFDLSMRNGSTLEREHTFRAGMMGIDLSSEGPIVQGKRASYLFNYRYSTLGIIDQFLPAEDVVGIKYQDLAFKFHFPTAKHGIFSVWGLGLRDDQDTKADRDSSKWEYQADRENYKIGITMGVAGLTHRYFLSDRTYFKTSLAGTLHRLSAEISQNDDRFAVLPTENSRFDNTTLVLSAMVNHKFSATHTNQTGVTLQGVGYDVNFNWTETAGTPLQNVTDDSGRSLLMQAYSQSTFRFGQHFTLNPGVHAQHFALTGRTVFEPRISARLRLDGVQSVSAGYGKHSQLERLHNYLAKTPGPDAQANRDLDFGKAHHFVLSYDRMLGEHTRLKVEPYAQFLYDIPVIPDSSFSFLNLYQEWYVNEALANTGKGRNLGVDLTLERFLHRGWYYLITASIFDSRYAGGDGVWRNTRYNKNLVQNILVGKEWEVGKLDQNRLNLSLRTTYMRGDRYNGVDINASLAAEDVIEDPDQVFAQQWPSQLMVAATASYRINRKNHSSLWSFQILNAAGAEEYYGHLYNFRHRRIDREQSKIVIPNLSYKIEF